VEHWWSGTVRGKSATCHVVILYFVAICTSGPFARRVKCPQVTDVCQMYRCHTLRGLDRSFDVSRLTTLYAAVCGNTSNGDGDL
jgi:hypothetical protein